MSGLAFDQAFRIGMGETPARFPTPLDRLIYLRTLDTLGGLASSGLRFIASQAKERQFAAGEVIYRKDEPIEAVHFLVEGRIHVEQEDLHILDAVPPFTIGFLPVLSSSKIGQQATALEPTVTLEITRNDLFEIFEDDFVFLENGLRQLSRQMLNHQRELEVRGLLSRSEPEEVPYPHERLDLVERLTLLQQGPYSNVNLEPLVQLVRNAPELRLEAGAVLWEAGDPATWGAHIIYGVVACTAENRTFRMGPGSVIGFLDANSSLPRDYRAVAESKVVLLVQDAEASFDVLEDNFPLAIGMLAFMSGMVLDLSVQVARAKQQETATVEQSDA